MTPANVIGVIAACIIGAAFILPISVFAWRRFRAQGAAFVLIMAGFLWAAATKPSATFDTGIANNGTHFTNNFATVCFRWTRTDVRIPNEQPLYISSQPIATPESDWTSIGSSTVAAGALDVNVAQATNYRYFVWHEWSPPSPVHTNGVWLGTIIEPAKGNEGPAKMVIVNGKLIENGKVIATP